jgi:uncharacterized alpha/beta hydrolase family protein
MSKKEISPTVGVTLIVVVFVVAGFLWIRFAQSPTAPDNSNKIHPGMKPMRAPIMHLGGGGGTSQSAQTPKPAGNSSGNGQQNPAQ